jgi:hypothetical protein
MSEFKCKRPMMIRAIKWNLEKMGFKQCPYGNMKRITDDGKEFRYKFQQLTIRYERAVVSNAYGEEKKTWHRMKTLNIKNTFLPLQNEKDFFEFLNIEKKRMKT